MTLAIDHETVRQSEDRTWTLRLIDEVRSSQASKAERDDALTTLAHLEDPRSVVPLTEIVENRSLPEAIRDAASKVLGGFDDCTTGERRRAWWKTREPMLMAHSLRLMERAEADIVFPVAGDDAHPLQRLALLAMTWGFDEPQFQNVKIRALGHPDADVRSTAADVLMWDEPVAAEGHLLRAAADTCSDVAIAAIDALQYYPSRRVLRALADLAATADGDELRAKVTESLDYNRGRFEYVATHGGDDQMALARDWMAPVADIVRWSDALQEPDAPSSHSGVSRVAASEPDLVALIADAEGEWAAKKRMLHRIDWETFTTAERERLGKALTSHPDPAVRALAGVPLAAWRRSDLLLGLIADPCLGVRKSAMYSLGLVPKDETLAAPVWEYMVGAAGTTAHESLQTYVTHAPAAEARERLLELARNERRESVATTAIESLVKLNASAEFETLVSLLHDPPGVTWAVHIRLIDGLRALGLAPPVLDDLASVDNLDLMESIAALRCSAG